MKADPLHTKPHEQVTTTSSSSSSSTSSAISERDYSGAEMSAGDDMLIPWDLDSKWTKILGGDVNRAHSETELLDEPMGWEQREELLQLPPLSGTDFPFITNSRPLNTNRYDLPVPSEFPLNVTSTASQQCVRAGAFRSGNASDQQCLGNYSSHSTVREY
ncbi:hypothetical protein PITC_005310 [Penicillium italicum]|uniref:Uncharacterized protein n=1 Tax=Penicillium italicum TaxID=40296 RepID=A0A0A2LAB8_PENIT|nr:hypothetical protein PITC_005310 [Penicillium italicum]